MRISDTLTQFMDEQRLPCKEGIALGATYPVLLKLIETEGADGITMHDTELQKEKAKIKRDMHKVQLSAIPARKDILSSQRMPQTCMNLLTHIQRHTYIHTHNRTQRHTQ